MSSSAIKNAFIYALTTLCTAAFGAIYEAFSHNVYSYYMIYAFIFPLAAGACFWLVIALSKRQIVLSDIFTDLQAGAIATCTVGFLLKGALEIYGTDSRWCRVYLVLGIIMSAAAAVRFVTDLKRRYQNVYFDQGYNKRRT